MLRKSPYLLYTFIQTTDTITDNYRSPISRLAPGAMHLNPTFIYDWKMMNQSCDESLLILLMTQNVWTQQKGVAYKPYLLHTLTLISDTLTYICWTFVNEMTLSVFFTVILYLASNDLALKCCLKKIPFCFNCFPDFFSLFSD